MLLERCASPGFAVVALLLLTGGVMVAHLASWEVTAVLMGPFAIAALALLALVLWRRQGSPGGGLAVCHFSLLVMIALVGVGRLSTLQGWVEVASGEWFEGQLMGEERAPWHRGALSRVRFQNLGFEVVHGPELRRRQTRNRVAWRDEGGEGVAEIGDGEALFLAGYRFSTSGNKGYAPLFVWQPAAGGPTVQGTVNLPSFPLFVSQSNHWQIPGGGEKLLVHLRFDQPFPPRDSGWVFPGAPRHHLVITAAGESWEMRPGERRSLPAGVLIYRGLGSWMGYRVFHDWTMPWLLAAAVVASLGLTAHLAARFAADPWHRHWGVGGE